MSIVGVCIGCDVGCRSVLDGGSGRVKIVRREIRSAVDHEDQGAGLGEKQVLRTEEEVAEGAAQRGTE